METKFRKWEDIQTEPVVRAVGTAVALTILQIFLLYVLNAFGFFEENRFYALFSYPFSILYGIISHTSNIIVSSEGATQILHPERVFMRVFFVFFSTSLVYFLLKLGLNQKSYGEWKTVEGILEAVGVAVGLGFVQVGILYFVHLFATLEAFKFIYNTFFFPFDYVFAIIKFTMNTLIGENERIEVLNTDIFKRIFFVIFTVNIIWFALSEWLRSKNEDNR